MRKYLLSIASLALLFLWHPSPAHAQWLFPTRGAARCSAMNVGAGNTVSCNVVNTLARAQVVEVKWCDTSTACTVDTSADTFAITDGSGNTYGNCVRMDAASGTDRRGMAICHAQNILASASNMVTLTVTSANPVSLAGLIVTEVSGGTATLIKDASGTLDLAATASPMTISTSGATVRGNELIFTWGNLDAGTLFIGDPTVSKGGMGTNYANSFLGTCTEQSCTALDQWNNASPRNTIKTETMKFSGAGFPLNPTQQQRAIIVTYYSPAQLAPNSLTFNNQAIGTTSALQPITFSNTGLSNINISNLAFTGTNAGDFAIDGSSTCAISGNVGVDHNCNLYIKFTPSATGARTATVRFFTSASGSPHVVSLSGTGI